MARPTRVLLLYRMFEHLSAEERAMAYAMITRLLLQENLDDALKALDRAISTRAKEITYEMGRMQ